MGLLPDTLHCGLRMRRECRERFPRHRLQRKPPVSDPGMHPGTCVTHVPWCMPRSLTLGGGENVPGIPGTCTTRNFRYLARGPWGCRCHLVMLPGARSTNDISIEFEIRPKFQVLWFKMMYSTDHKETWHTSRQCNCSDMCKVLLWSVEHILD